MGPKKLGIRNVFLRQQLARVKRSGAQLITKGVYRLRLGRTNGYLVLHGSSAILVDSGLPTHLPAITGLLAEVGLAVEDLDLILLTHRHLDHAGSAEALRIRSGAPVVVHRADAEAVQGRQTLSPVRSPFGLALDPLVSVLDHRVFGFRPCADVIGAEEGWRHRRHGDFVLVHLPGHTPGHSGWYYEPAGVVFCGDAAMNSANHLRGPSRLFSLDPVQVRRSLGKLADLEAEVYCFGHGPPLFRGSAALRRLSQQR